MQKNVWLIGAGPMSLDYLKVLQAQSCKVLVIGRGEASASAFETISNVPVTSGGLTAYLASKPEVPDAAIVVVGVEALADTTLELLRYGVKSVLVEKPGSLDYRQLQQVVDLARQCSADVCIAYNRRFYASLIEAEKMILQDGGVRSFQFELTEWGHVIESLDKGSEVKKAWFLANSTHVADMAFHLGGLPQELHALQAGGLAWHPQASRFAGAGVSEKQALFSYCANWASPGRWGVEVLTDNYRLIFRPLEALQIMRKGGVAVEQIVIDDRQDKEFKPGLFVQVSHFLKGDRSRICTLEQQLVAWPIYERMAGYA